MSQRAQTVTNGWTEVKISDVATVIRGASPRPKGDPRFYGGPIPRLMVEDVTRDGKVVYPSVDSLTEEGARRSRPCPAGTLTLVCSGTVGIPSFLGVDACIHDGFIGLVNIKPSFSSDFIFHQLQRLRAEFDASATHGGVFTNLTTKGVEAFSFHAPQSLTEQQAIASALSDADGVVAGLERVIAKKRLIKQGAMQDLLTARRRLPGFSGEWEVKPFAQIARIRNTKVQTLGNTVAQNCIELEQVESETGRILYWADATNRATVKYQFEPDDVLFGRLRPYLRKFHRANIQGVCSTEIWPLMTQGINGGFLYQVIQSDGFIAAACESYGTHMPRADWGKIATHQIQVPVDRKEQQAIGEVLADMENEIQTLESRLVKARAVKEGMMQDLLTGRVRLV